MVRVTSAPRAKCDVARQAATSGTKGPAFTQPRRSSSNRYPSAPTTTPRSRRSRIPLMASIVATRQGAPAIKLQNRGARSAPPMLLSMPRTTGRSRARSSTTLTPSIKRKTSATARRGDEPTPCFRCLKGSQRWQHDAHRRLDERLAKPLAPVPHARAKRLVVTWPPAVCQSGLRGLLV